MKVVLAGDEPAQRTCIWYPDENASVFPTILQTTDGRFFRLIAPPLSGIRPEHDLNFIIEPFNYRAPRNALNEFLSEFGDQIEPELKGELVKHFEPMQQFLNDQASLLAECAMKIAELERQLKAKQDGA